jgi:hypothetical protein
MRPRCAVLIDLPPEQRFHHATIEALRHAINARAVDIDIEVRGTDQPGLLHDGVVIGPGSPYRRPEAAEAAIADARARGVPLVAT